MAGSNKDGNQGRDAVQRYTRMRDALAATGRPIILALCEWGENQPWRWAGAVGNLIDRVASGAVTDFIDVYVSTHHWPAFNVADIAITFGVLTLLYVLEGPPRHGARRRS